MKKINVTKTTLDVPNQIMHIMEEQTDKRTDYWIETEE